MKAKIKRKIHHGTRFITRAFEYTGMPQGYAATVAWFAERMVLASLCLAVLSFAAGIVFAVKFSEPIVESKFYNDTLVQANYAQQQVIDMVSPVFASLIKANHQDVDLEAQARADRKVKIQTFLASKNSPLAKDDDALNALTDAKNTKMIIAISFVESTYAQHCYYYNCSGIGGPNLRKYKSYGDWVRDFDNLLEDRYKDVPPEKFVGIYVQPGSPNWIYGVNQSLKEMKAQEI